MRWAKWVGAGALLAAGCGGGGVLPPNQPVQHQLALTKFGDDDCEGLRKYIAGEAATEVLSQLEMLRKNGPVFYGAEDTPTAGAPAPGTATQSASGPSSYTTTNTQVAGVDEADFVKNDGTRIFVLSGQNLYMASSWPADSLALTATVAIEGWPREMYLDGNTLEVFSAIYTPEEGPIIWGGAPMAMPVCIDGPCGYWWSNTTKVTQLDVTDLAHPKVVGETYLPGMYSNSRRVGDSVRIVLSDNFRWPAGVSFWPDNFTGRYDDKVAWNAAIDQTEQKDLALINAQPIEKWLPDGKRKLEDGTELDLPYKCSEFSKTNAPTHLGILSVATIDLAQKAPAPQRTSVIADVGTVYASPGALYVATPHWWWWPEPGQQAWTYLYKFDITDPTQASFVAGGAVEGYVADQFSLDEKDGNLRVASNLENLVDDGSMWGQWKQSNRISVLAQHGATLEEIGKTAEIAPGEWLSGARFFGDQAFVTTFKYVDPFFTFDLSDPAHPKAVGQLQVAGMSTYLQTIDATHVLAIGIDVPQSDVGGTVGSSSGEPLLLSLFDTSDFAHPTLAAQQQVGVGYAWSQAMWDHKAFNWYPERKLLAIPFSDWVPYADPSGTGYWDGFVSDLRVFSVDPAVGITAKGALSMADVYQSFNDPYWSWYWSPQIERSVMADDYVYAISNAGIRVENVNSLGTPIATVQFNPPATTP
jgi:hypothetical protein